MLAKLVDKNEKKYWYKVLPEVEYAINNSVHKTSGETPSMTLFGIKQRGQTRDKVAEYLRESDEAERNLDEIRSKVEEKTTLHQKQNEVYANKKRKTPCCYEPGDLVMIRNFDNIPGASKKLIPYFKGPYEVVKVLRNDRYVLKSITDYQNNRTPYQGVWQENNMRPWLRSE